MFMVSNMDKPIEVLKTLALGILAISIMITMTAVLFSTVSEANIPLLSPQLAGIVTGAGILISIMALFFRPEY